MRDSPGARRRAGPAALRLALAFASSALVLAAQGAAPLEGKGQSLEPAFRFPAGGRPVAGPLLDASTSPALVWMVSEDGSLYGLSEAGRLVTRVSLNGLAVDRLGLDPFGRVLVCSGSLIQAYTRAGVLAWQRDMAAPVDFLPVFGSDGRAFVVTGSRLFCLNPSGAQLWTSGLSASPPCQPAVDGDGDAAIALGDGTVALFGPYGREIARVRSGAAVRSLAPMASGPDLPALALGLADGRVLLLDSRGDLRAQIRPAAGGGGGQAGVVALQWDGALLVGLDSGGRAFAASAAGGLLWSTETGCAEGRLSLFASRVVVTSRGRAVSLSTTGQVYREAEVVHAAGVGAVSPAGLLFSPGEDWILAAYRFERPLGAPRLPSLQPYPAAAGVRDESLAFDPAAGEGDRQLILLADIEKRLISGTIGTDEGRAAAYCSAVALGELEPDSSGAGRHRHADPLPRSRACAILGELGSPDYRGALCRVLATDEDSAVRAAACSALGAIAVDPGGESSAAFLAAAAFPADEQTALALMEAIERISLYSGSAPSVDAVRALLTLARLPYGASVRDRAVAALGRIAGAAGQ